MKRIGLLIGLIGMPCVCSAQNTVATDDAAYVGNASAMLDIKSISKGLLIPRVNLASVTDQVTIGGAGAEPDGLLVYDEGTTIPEGFYFWDNANAVWVAYVAGINGKSVFVGQSSGANDDDDAQNNTAIGYESLKFNVNGTGNTVLGYQSGLGVTGNSFSNNTLIGSQAGSGLTTGSNNVFLGNLAGSAETAASNKLIIENSASSTPLVYGEFDNNLVKVNGSLEVANGAATAGNLSLYEDSDNGTSKVTVTAPSLAADYTLTLPVDDGTNGQLLRTDGSGVLSWTNAGASSIWSESSGLITTQTAGADLQLDGNLLVTTDNIVFSKVAGSGIKVDVAAPTYPWQDLSSDIVVRGTGATDPPWEQIGATAMWAYKFKVNDECWLSFHIPHDYVPGTQLYMHVHWMPSGTDGNTVKWQFDYTYARGHGQQAFNIGTLTTATALSAAPTLQYQHMVSETVGQTIANCEPDGIVYVHIKRITNGATDNANSIFVLKADVHYQTTGIGTKSKSPNFYN